MLMNVFKNYQFLFCFNKRLENSITCLYYFSKLRKRKLQFLLEDYKNKMLFFIQRCMCIIKKKRVDVKLLHTCFDNDHK